MFTSMVFEAMAEKFTRAAKDMTRPEFTSVSAGGGVQYKSEKKIGSVHFCRPKLAFLKA
jgi:hypothetical protein